MKSFFEKYYVVILIGIFSIISYKFYFVCDDAYISFTYSKNLASGYGLVFNRGVPPVEGYTNFLWVIIGSIFYLLNINLNIIMPSISYLFCFFFICFIDKILINKFCFSKLTSFFTILFSLVLFPSFFIYSTSGLETIPYAVLMFLLFYYLIISANDANKKKYILITFLSLSLSLIRFEGIFFAIFIYMLSLIRKKFNKKAFLLFLSLYFIYYIGRWLYFGELFPNTVYMKVSFSLALLKRGFNYNIIYLLTEPLTIFSLFGLVVMFKRKVDFFLEYAILYFSLFIYPIIVGGDFLPYSRFLTPFCLIQVIALSYLISSLTKKYLLIILGAFSVVSFLSSFNIMYLSRDILKIFHFRYNTTNFRTERESYDYLNDNNYKRKLLSDALNKYVKDNNNMHGTKSLVLGGIGLVSYYTDFVIYDIYGLVNKDLRNVKVNSLRSPGHDKRVPPSYFLKYKPDFTEIYINLKDRRENAFKNTILNNKMYNDYERLSLPTNDNSISILLLKRKM